MKLAERTIMKRLALLGLSLLLTLPVSAVPSSSIDLAGEWQVSLQPPSTTSATWAPIRLPGTLTDAGIGAPLQMKPELTLATLARLQTKFSHIGPAWYRRQLDIPPDWAGRRIVLELERVLWESEVWVDGRYAGRADSLVTPHVHDLSAWLPPGRHELQVRIDNREIHPGLSYQAKSYPAR
jgi:beta-galactosidase/beta-glucuronidase